MKNKAIKCPFCDTSLDKAALNDGWCPECGKAIPRFAKHANDPTPEELQRQADYRTFAIFAVLLPVGFALGILEAMALKGQLGSASEPVLRGLVCLYGGMTVLYLLNFVLNGKTGSPPLGD